jgi:hypothetical protein
MSMRAAGIPTKIQLARPARPTVLLQLHPYVLIIIIMLYPVLSTPVLLLLDWHYIGGGGELEKIHPATYMLLVGICISLLIDSRFRWRILTHVASDLSLLLFLASVVITTFYCYVAKGASISPFVDTFIGAIVVSVILNGISRQPLVFLRRLVDVFFIGNALLIFWEIVAQQNILADFLISNGHIREMIDVFGPQQAAGGFSRASALFNHPLDAAMLLGVYCISNLVSTPVHFSFATIKRLLLSLLSYVAIFPTGGRTSIVVTTLIVLLYMIYIAIAWFLRGSIKKAGLTFALLSVVILVPLSLGLWDIGFFDPMLGRFEVDYGSALSRDYAFELLEQVSAFDLWFGLPLQDIIGLQLRFGLIAIEISWINFILVGGLITAIPLFITYILFLFRSIPLYCNPGIYFVSLLVFVVTAASNGIWSKTTVLTISLVVAISFLRRDLQPYEG